MRVMDRRRRRIDPSEKIEVSEKIDITGGGECGIQLGRLFKDVAAHVAGFFLMYILCHLSHYLLKPYSQPRITSDTFIGLVIGNISIIRKYLPETTKQILHNIVDFGMICYMFVLGLEMDPYVLFKVPTKDAKLAYAGMLSTFMLACGITPFLRDTPSIKVDFTLSLSMVLSSTASPVLTRIITSTKIGKSDIGQLVIATGMHSDFIATLLLCIGYVFWPNEDDEKHRQISRSLEMGGALLVQTLFTALVSPIFMNWVNNENPEGKPMKGSHLVLSLAFMALVVSCSPFWGYSTTLSAFMAGIFLPRDGRVSKWIIGKINYLLSTIFYPIFFFWMGYEANFGEFRPGDGMTWARLFSLFAIATIGKVAGTVISGAMLGFHWPESVALGLLLTTKGHFHIYLAIVAKSFKRTSTSTTTVMIIAIFFTVVHAPSVVAQIIKRARKRAPIHRMSLQLLDPSSELRILLCIHGTQNICTAINFIEISRGAADPGIVVYVTDIIERTDAISATLVKGEDGLVTVTDAAVTEMREQVTAEIQAYVGESGPGITLRRLLAVSPFNDMPQDICDLADDSKVALIILPFHKAQHANGTLDSGHSGFRYVNRKVLRNAPCSVGILVDRGFGLIEKISRSYDHAVDMAVIFIGGKDDREALAYAGHVSRHPGVKLTVIRFLVDSSATDASSRTGSFQVTRAQQEEEMKLDDECFAKFYEKHVACGQVAYMEKHLANSSETYTTLRALDGQYSLIIVGRGERVNTVLTFGMNDWQQCPELGPIGDVLSGSDFSVATSVLIIQQNDIKGQLDGLNDDFSVM